MNRILWNARPTSPSDAGDIDEVVIENPSMVHVEQMGDRCWWIGIDMPDGGHWMGNFTADSRGRMRFSQQENAGINWTRDEEHR